MHRHVPVESQEFQGHCRECGAAMGHWSHCDREGTPLRDLDNNPQRRDA